MPLFQVDVEKQTGAEFWTNRYHTIAVDLAQAVAIGNFIVDQEKLFHLNVVAYRTLRVRSATVGDDVYSIVPLSDVGAVGTTAAAVWPLFNVLRVDFTAVAGRPSRKYYRGCLHDDTIAGGVIDPSYLSLVSTSLAPLLEETLCDVDAQFLVGAVPFNTVHMRQLRRGSTRRTQPIL